MKPFLIGTIAIIISFYSSAQITQGNWLVGGMGSFSSTKSTFENSYVSSTTEEIDIKISPNFGYFILDKLAVGIKPSYSKSKAQVTGSGGIHRNTDRFEIGPFARYYFLNVENQYNIVSEANYQYGIYNAHPGKGKTNTFSFLTGPVIYFNNVVGLEFLLGYYKRIEDIENNYKTEQKGFQISIGFQIHLEPK